MGCGQFPVRPPETPKFVDKAVVAAPAGRIGFGLPEGAADSETEPAVLASTETEPGRKFLRAFRCPPKLASRA